MGAVITLLVIDDDPNVTDSVRRGLNGLGTYAVHTAGSGPEGLQAARELRPDAILLDLMMPGMGGAEVYRLLRQDEATARTPCVFLTGMIDKEGADSFLGPEPGAICLAKPASLAEIEQAVARALRNA